MSLIADSGSTKTAWCLIEDPEHVIYTQGINPYQQNEEEICAILQHELLPNLISQSSFTPHLSAIHFYGAGCTPEKAPIVAQALRQVVSTTATIHVESDMLGAARGLCGRQPGIVAILGTGSNSCFYYIGKRLVGDILKHQLPDDICQLFFDETHETQANIIQRVYRTSMPNRYLASLSPFCARHREHPAIHDFLLDCFGQFFRRNIIPLTSNHNLIAPSLSTVHFIGSIAHYYRAELSEAATCCGYSVGTILQSPLEGLIEYHQNT